MSNWMNNDGLYIKFGQSEGLAGVGGNYAGADQGGTHVLELEVDLTSLATGSELILSDNVNFPTDYIIERVEIMNLVAATSGGVATLDIGLVRRDRTTAIDEDGIVAGAALATFDAVGETVVIRQGTTGAGALVGTVSPEIGYVTAGAGTAVFTAGRIRVRIFLTRR